MSNSLTAAPTYSPGPIHKALQGIPVIDTMNQLDIIDFNPAAPHTTYLNAISLVLIILGLILCIRGAHEKKRKEFFIGVILIAFGLLYSLVNI